MAKRRRQAGLERGGWAPDFDSFDPIVDPAELAGDGGFEDAFTRKLIEALEIDRDVRRAVMDLLADSLDELELPGLG